jgi:DNA-binding PadR family transcriptional regulator
MNAQDVILGMLQKRSYSGYELKHYFESVFSFFFDASFGTIYPTLSRMEQLGYITKESIQQDNRPNKNIYTITDRGQEQFRLYLSSGIEKQTFRSDLLMRLYFGEFVERDVVIKWLQDELQEREKKLAQLEADKFCNEADKNMTATQRICIQIGIESSRTMVRVLSESITSLENL